MPIRTKTAAAYSVDTDDVHVHLYRDNGVVKVRASVTAKNADGAGQYLELEEVAAAALKTEAAKVVSRLLAGWT